MHLVLAHPQNAVEFMAHSRPLGVGEAAGEGQGAGRFDHGCVGGPSPLGTHWI